MNNRKPKYGYRYDGLNRLTASYYHLPGTAIPRADSYNTSYSYDANGNILFLERFGGEDDPTLPPTEMDDLEYTYDLGNRLKKVKDHSNAPAGFDPGTAGTNAQYTYDDFGNLETDPYKGITNIVYNHLNPEASAGQALPTEITFQGGEKIEYLYTADGTKLAKDARDGQGAMTTTEYRQGFQYENDVLEFFPHTSASLSAGGEGYVKTTEIGGQLNFTYVFHFVDHLGNIRLKYTEHPQTGETAILEQNHYYPYGLKHTGYNPDHQVIFEDPSGGLTLMEVDPFLGDSHTYKFGGKEYQDEFNINTYDFGTRNYDPALGRWMNLDPLAEMMRRHSPYNYAFDNPVYFIDPDGMAPIAGALKSGLFVQNTNFLGVSDISGGLVGTMGRGNNSNEGGESGKQIRNTFSYDDKGKTKGTDRIQQTEFSTTVVNNSSGHAKQRIESTTITTAYVDADGNVKKDVFQSTYSHIYSKNADGSWSRSDPIDQHTTTTLSESGSDFQSYVNGVAEFKSSAKISPIQAYANQIENTKTVSGYVSLGAGILSMLIPEPIISKGLGVTSAASGSAVFLSSNPEKLKITTKFK